MMRGVTFRELTERLNVNCGPGSIKAALWELGVKPFKNVTSLKNKSVYVGVYPVSVIKQVKEKLLFHGYKQL